MLASVIVAVFNGEEIIGGCLESLSKQSLKDFEVIVVDDGSTDATLKRLKTIKIPKLRVLTQEHKGAGAARNFGAKKAKGDILVFVDADMTFEEDFISKLIDPIGKNGVIGTFSKEEFMENQNNIWAVCWNLNRGLPKNRMHGKDYPERQKVFRAILREKFDEVGGFDVRRGYTDDWTLSERLGVLAVNAPGAIFYHKNPGSLSEVFRQSKWMAKRTYKLGVAGILIALVRVSLPISIPAGLIGVVRFMIPGFFIFKLVSDFGQFVGIFEYIAGKVSK